MDSNNYVGLPASEISRLRERDKLCSVLLVAFGALIGSDPFSNEGELVWTPDLEGGGFKKLEILRVHAAKFKGQNLSVSNVGDFITIELQPDA